MTQLGAGYHHFWPRGLLEFLGRRREDFFFSLKFVSLLIQLQLLRQSHPTQAGALQEECPHFWGRRRSWPGHGEAGCSGHHASTAGASSLHEQGWNRAQPGKVLQGLGQGMLPLPGILVSRSFMFTWNHNAPRAYLHQSILNCMVQVLRGQPLMAHGLARGVTTSQLWSSLAASPRPSPRVPDSTTAWEASHRLE